MSTLTAVDWLVIGAYFAIRNAMRAFRSGLGLTFSAPLTSEKILMALYGSAAGDESSEPLPSSAAVAD